MRGRGQRFWNPGAYWGVIRSRLLAAIPVLAGVSLLSFLMMNVLPGNAARQLLAADASASDVSQLERRLGLDRPVVERYWKWLSGVVRGDFGTSLISGQSATKLIAGNLPVTLELVFLAFGLSVGFAVLWALYAVYRPRGWVDRTGSVLSAVGLSSAPYVVGLTLVLLLAVAFPILPAFGYAPPGEGVLANLRSMALPAITLAFPLWAFYLRVLRADLLSQLREQDYILAARARGLHPWRILTRHALRNALPGLVAVVGLNFGTLFGSTVVVEQLFSLPGIGHLLLQAISLRDVVVAQAVVFLLGCITVVSALMADLAHAALDPRVRLEAPGLH